MAEASNIETTAGREEADNAGELSIITIISEPNIGHGLHESRPIDHANKATLRKRNRSVGAVGPESPESLTQLLEFRKKNKKNSSQDTTLERNTQKSKQTALNEQCVFCAKTGTNSNMTQCEICTQFYHLECCGIPTADHELVLEVIQIMGWTCRACRVDSNMRQSKQNEEISSLKSQLEVQKQQFASIQQQLDAMLARSLATEENAAVDGGEGGVRVGSTDRVTVAAGSTHTSGRAGDGGRIRPDAGGIKKPDAIF